MNTKPVVLSCFDGYSEDFHWKKKPTKDPKLPPSLRNLYKKENEALSPAELDAKYIDTVKKMNMDKAVIDFINKSTKNQSGSSDWHEQRTGRITSSTVHAVTHTDPDKPAPSVIKAICIPRTKPLKTDAINWGNEHETTALKAYRSLMESTNKHSEISVDREGFRISDEVPYIGVSTDSIMTCDCHGKRIVEVKCPFSAKDKDMKSFLDSADCYIKQNELKNTHKYYSQVQLQMFVYQVDSCDFVTWAPKFVIITYVKKDEKFVREMIDKCKLMYRNHILPELLTRKIENANQPTNDPTPVTAPTKLFCICQKPEDENEYVGCDNPECKIEWYHMSCLKLKRKPKGTWLCPACRKNKK